MPDIRHELVIGTSALSVYEALTSSEGLAGWWTPQNNAVAEQGAVIRFYFGSDYFKAMKITHLSSPTLVEWQCVNGANEWVDTTISFKLKPGDKRSLLAAHNEAAGQLEQQTHAPEFTLLSFAHNNWRDYTPMYAECNYTWGRFLRSLKLFCETGKGTPWPDQHGV